MKWMRHTAWALLSCFCVTAYGQEGLDVLLKQVQEGAQQTSQINQEREKRFLANKAQQEALLAQAQAERALIESRVDQIKQRFEANQKQMAELKSQLAARGSDYTQVYAAARQTAQEQKQILAESLISAQFPKRLESLEKLATDPALPSINALEGLWLAMQQEMTEQGRTVSFTTDVVNPMGIKASTKVVRVGPFAAFANGDYLVMPTGGGTLRALGRQPSRSEQRLAVDFAAATTPRAPILIDPTRGALLAVQVDRPTVSERIEQGGWPGYVIIAVGICGFLVAMLQFLYLLLIDYKVGKQRKNPLSPSANNPLGRILMVFKDDVEKHDPEVLELRLSEAVLKETPAIERAQPFIRLVIAAGPLLGLLGTVVGMIETFQVMIEAGRSDPKLMADGISKAMIATVLGLGIAIPLLFINAWLVSRSRALVQILDEQSAGLLAERIEAQAALGRSHA